MATTTQQISGIADPSHSPAEWVNILLREESSSNNISAHKSASVTISPLLFFKSSKLDQPDRRIESNGAASPDERNSVIEDSFAAHRGRSRSQHHHIPRTLSHLRSKSRVHSPVALAGLTFGSGPVSRLALDGSVQRFAWQSLSREELGEATVSRQRVACRFSREDYRHYQIMEWLERDVKCSQKSD